jgi:predicted 2-oxoglutarate/Fe(II)-dependent dioxygenase YbiX
VPRAEVLARLGGLWFAERFLTPDECRALRDEMAAASGAAATVRDVSGQFTVDPAARRVQWVDVAGPSRALVAARLEAARPRVADHYGIPLAGIQPPQFLVYAPGDFYRPHRDNTPGRDRSQRDDVPPAPGVSHERRISAVLFVNGHAAEPTAGAFGGGALTFYGLIDDPRTEALGISIEAQEGLLITFPASLVHGVSPVEHGHRYTAVSWYHG